MTNYDEGDMTVPKYPVARLAIALAPWFGHCAGTCHRELGLGQTELVARLVSDDEQAFGFWCVECLTEFVDRDAMRQMDHDGNCDTPQAHSRERSNVGRLNP